MKTNIDRIKERLLRRMESQADANRGILLLPDVIEIINEETK